MGHEPRRGCYVLHLSCLYCTEEGQFGDGLIQTLAQALAAARSVGWKTRKDKEVCPKCLLKRESLKR